MYRILKHERFSDTTFLWEVHAPDVARSAEAGHFVMLRLRDGGERIPLTVADFDRSRGSVTLVVQVVGKTTKEMLDHYAEGDAFSDFAGPLGLPSEVENYGHVVVVGGGLGVAPIFPQLRAFKEAGNRTTAIIGFRSKSLVFWEERFRPWCDELIVCTDDGSYARKGFVTEALAEVATRSEKPHRVVAVGPLPMMRACAEVTRPHAIPTVVSLNAIMVDGTGMCGSCRVSIGGEIRFACVDGPEFDAHAVDFAELMRRQTRFRSEEAQSTESYAHVCNLEKQLFDEEKRNYKKIRELPPHATAMPERPADERSKNFEEVNLGYGMSEALVEAERCIQCRNPTCISGCPVAIDIPRFIRHLLVRDLAGAQAVIRESNLFPSICGRVCPQESQCEAQCVIAKKVEAVAIGRLERFVGDHAPKAPIASVAKQTNGKPRRVAIVGSGPGGLSCAADLAKQGVGVTIYEALHVVGGVLSYGIPAFRLPRAIIDREIQGLKDLGVVIETNKIVGKTFTIDRLLGEMGYHAIFIATGAGYPSFLGIPGEHAGRVYSANEFLTRVNLMGGDRFPHRDTPIALGNEIVVLGAGNTAMDCLRVARRLGGESVHCVYRRTEAEAPARIEEIRHAKEEGVEFHWLRSPVEILTNEAGDVRGIRCQVMELGPPDASGRRKPNAVEGAFDTFDCDTVIYALGTRANPIISQSTPGLETHRGGYIVANAETQATSHRGVFAGGDIVTGGATVILAMGAGRNAAKGILAYFENESAWPPVLPKIGGEAPPTEAPGAQSCPKCHRPILGDEEYVCCSDAPVRWRCSSCSKVSEGFAFPYGLCPACGGRLEADGSHEVATPGAREAIRRAFEFELGGAAFYERCAATTTDPSLRDLFDRLVQMEQEHVRTLMARYHVDPPGSAAPTLAALAVYGDVEIPTTGEGLLRMAVDLEKRARDFFRSQHAVLEEGSEAWKLYRELAAEEQEHVDLLSTELARYHRGKPGLL